MPSIFMEYCYKEIKDKKYKIKKEKTNLKNKQIIKHNKNLDD